METLQFERGAAEGGGGMAMGSGRAGVEELIEMARGLERDGRPMLDDPVVRDRIAAFGRDRFGQALFEPIAGAGD